MIMSIDFVSTFVIPNLDDDEVLALRGVVIGTANHDNLEHPQGLMFDYDLTALPVETCRKITKALNRFRETQAERDQKELRVTTGGSQISES
jgi:hypothetical protein